MRLIDADALSKVITRRHDFFRGCTAAPEKARRDELLQVMCDINEQTTIAAIPMEWLEEHDSEGNEYGRRYITVVEALSMWEKKQEAR